MNIRTHSRIVSLVLALVMILPLISIPAFAEDAVAPMEYSANLDGATLGDVLASYPASSQIVAAADPAHGDVLQIDLKGMGAADYYLWKDANNKWPITGDLASGEAKANGLTIPAVAELPANDDDATKKVTIDGTTYTIVTAAYADAMGGFVNFAKPAHFKNPYVASASYAGVAVSIDIYLSEDFMNTSDVTGRFGASAGNVELFAISAPGGNNPTFTKHENGKIVSGSAAALKKGEWNTLTFVIDLQNAMVFAFLNGEFAFQETNSTALNTAVDLKASNLQVQVDRTRLPSTNDGYIQIDNVKMTSDLSDFGGTLYNQDFNAATSFSDVAGTSPLAGLATITEADKDAATHGNVLHQGTVAGAAGRYFIYKDNNNKTEITNVTIGETGLISGTAGSYKVTDSVLNDPSAKPTTLAKDENGADIAGYYVVTGEFADSMCGGVNNIAGNGGRINNPAVPYSAGVLNTVTLSAKYYFSPDAKGAMQGTVHTNGGVSDRLDLFQVSFSNGIVKLSAHGDTGSVYLKGGANYAIPAGEWFTLDLVVNMANGQITAYVDGILAFSVIDKTHTAGAFNLTAGTWAVTMFSRGSLPTTRAGYAEVDDCTITYGNAMPKGMDYLYYNNFNAETLNSAPSTDKLSIAVTDSIVTDAYGSKAWQINYDHSAAYNSDKNNMLKNVALSYETYSSIVIEADYFIVPGANGQIQCQGRQLLSNGATFNSGWNDLYIINFEGSSAATLLRESGAGDGSAKLAVGAWHTVSAVLNLVTGDLDIYLNGKLVIESEIVPDQEYGNLVVSAGKIIIGKTNKKGTDSTFLLDNIAVYEGTAPVAAPADDSVMDFEEFKYLADGTSALRDTAHFVSLPSLVNYAKDGNNVSVRLPMASAGSANSYMLAYKDGSNIKPASLGTVTYDPANPTAVNVAGTDYTATLDEETNRYTIVISDVTYYVVSAADWEAINAGNNVAKAFKYNHGTISYKEADKVMLQADYFIEAGSKGRIESQFEKYQYDTIDGETATTNEASWMQLFQIDTATGYMSNQGARYPSKAQLTIGAWNNIKLILDLKTGEYDIYLNDVWAYTMNAGKTNIIIGAEDNYRWSFAKVVRENNLANTTDVFAGAVRVDNISVSTQVASNAKYNDMILTDAAYDALFAGLLTGVNGASARIKDVNTSGIRFATKVDAEKLANLQTRFGATAGTIITPEAYIALAGGEFTKEALDALSADNSGAQTYLDVPFQGEYFSTAVASGLGEGDFMVGSIVNILADNITRKFAGIGYVTVTIGDYTTTIYSDVYCARSVQEIATAALDDESADFSAAQIAILEAYKAGNRPE